MNAITSYSIVDHGIDGAQYFPGCGVMGTDYDHVATGNGDTFAEAIENALEQMAQGTECDGIDFDAFEKRMLADEGLTVWPSDRSAMTECRKVNGHMSDEEWETSRQHEECDVYYYVSSRYTVAEVSQHEVIVGNIGTVYSGTDSAEAERTYNEYVTQSYSHIGRAAGENVTLMTDGEPGKVHQGHPIGNALNGLRIIARTDDAVYVRIPEALQVPSLFAEGKCTCGRCDGSGKWDTLVIPTGNNRNEFTATVHMPDGAVQPFLDHVRKVKGVR